ncbi:hypothetical protein LMG19083_00058 [Ralstonia psammae]|uniref:Uncharacterized protein n=1 Tax=Ralstonia psammae TaxID=3058598 RepID=A0ABN9IAW9_9RALS|nr:hypothetical protein [Ralstonia sp. LMG 19083]CAJ0775644.1 hypothetical protein LMG19083_00058 [Ralstonia sp. LMG 19083]
MSLHLRPARQDGAILIESLIALAVLSVGAATFFRAFDYLEGLGHAASQLGAAGRSTLEQTQTH